MQVLPSGAIHRLFSGEHASSAFEPVLLIKECKSLVQAANDVRFKVKLADAEHVAPAVIMKNNNEENSLYDHLSQGKPGIQMLVKLRRAEVLNVNNKSFLFVHCADVAGPCPPELQAHTQQAYAHQAAAPGAVAQQGSVGSAGIPAGTPEKAARATGCEITPPPNQYQPAFRAQDQGSTSMPAAATCGAPPNPYGGSTAPYGGPANPYGGPANPYGGPANPYGGPANPYGGPVASAPAVAAPPIGSQPAPNIGTNPQPRFGGGSLTSYFSPVGAQSASAGPQATGSARGSGGVSGTVPISSLSPYTAGRWRIRARLTMKGDIRTFNNARGEGKLMKVDLRDESSEIQATFFGKAVDINNARLQVGSVYYFSRGSVKAANKRFDRGEFVITFDDNTSIEDAEDDRTIGGVKYDFKDLAEVCTLPIDSSTDVAGVLCEVRECTSIPIKNGRFAGQERPKRDLIIWDGSGDPSTGTHIEMTLWGDKAMQEYVPESVVFMKQVVVREFQSRPTLSPSLAFSMEMNPDNPRAFLIAKQWEEKGKPPFTGAASSNTYMSGASASVRQTVQECREEDMRLVLPPAPGMPLDPSGPRSVHRHTLAGTVIEVPTDRPPYYEACPAAVDSVLGQTQQQAAKRTCNKKAVQEQDGTWRCAHGHTCSKPAYRYLCRVRVADHTGTMDARIFDECGARFFGCQADELASLWGDESRADELQSRLRALLWRRSSMKMRAQKEIWQEEERINYVMNDASDVSEAADAKNMLADIKAAIGAF